jgi:hypothetical protein
MLEWCHSNVVLVRYRNIKMSKKPIKRYRPPKYTDEQLQERISQLQLVREALFAERKREESKQSTQTGKKIKLPMKKEEKDIRNEIIRYQKLLSFRRQKEESNMASGGEL